MKTVETQSKLKLVTDVNRKADDISKNENLQAMKLMGNLINNISEIHPNIFHNCAKSLKHLELSDNQIEALDIFEPNMFHLKRLEYLFLDDYHIEHLDGNIYPKSSTRDIVLSLSDNRVKKINSDCNEVDPRGTIELELRGVEFGEDI